MEIIETGKSKKWILVVAAVILVAALTTYYFMVFKNSPHPLLQNNTEINGGKLPPGDTTVDINNALKAIDLGNPQAEIKNIDSDINNL